MRGHRGTEQHADPRRLREGLLEDLQRLGGEVGLHHRQPRDVAARARQARHVPEADGVGMGSEYDGDCRGRRSRRFRLGRGHREDEIDVHVDQRGGMFTQLLDPVRPPELDDDGLAFDVTEVAQASPQRFDPGRPGRSGAEPQEPDARHLRRLLRARSKRPAAAAPPSSVMNSRGCSLDHLVGAQQDRCRQRDADRFGGFEIDITLNLVGARPADRRASPP